MAEYTIELREIVEGGHNIFPFAYPFHDESKRAKFEQDFIRHFYFREIGVETVDKFIFYLSDKMNTVFPYYNELLKTATQEYAILDNYNLTETITREQENKDVSSGVSSSVGQVLDEQQTNNSETTTGSTTGKTNNTRAGTSETVGTGKETSESVGTSENNGSSETNNTETVNGNTTRNAENDSDTVKKFLDTPQGLTNLNDSKYLTTLNHDTTNAETSETVTTSESKTGKQTNTNNNSGNTTTDTERNTENNSTVTSSETDNGSEETTAEQQREGNATFNGEQRTTSDSNTRRRSEGVIKETVQTVRKGNIGVDSDADMYQKHIKLQQILQNVENMFFAECEDLFMLVF